MRRSEDSGREKRLDSLPLPPNRTCGSPASGSPVGDLPPRGLTLQRLGLCKREQPLRGKEGILPTSMVSSPAPTPAFTAASQNTTQAHPQPLVQWPKRRVVAVFERSLPPSPDLVDLGADFP